MNYLQFIVQELFSNNKNFENYTVGELWNYKFFTLLSLIFHVEIDKICIKKDIDDKYYLYVNDEVINHKEFDTLRKMVLFQNIYDYDDIEMSEDFKRVVQKYFALKSKGMKPLKLEDKIDVVVATMGKTIEEVSEMTYRRFCRVFENIIAKTEYIVGCYGYTRNEPPEHWVYKKDKGKYDMVVTDATSFANKMGGIKD